MEKLLNFIPEDNALQGKVVLVTGAGTGIGRAVALAAAYYGAEVVLLGHQVGALEAVYDEIMQLKRIEPSIYPLDMRGANQQDYLTLASNVTDQLDQLDALVLNAGWLPAYTPFSSYPLETWTQIFNVHVHGNFLLLQACLPALLESSQASVVYSSHSAEHAYAGAFGAARAAQDAMMKIFAEEHDNDNKFIRVNGIDSGPINTAMRRLNHPGDDPKELAEAHALVGPYLYYLSGDNLCEDGGQTTGERIRYSRLPASTQSPAFVPILEQLMAAQ